jgi:hypothetical protein
MAPSPIIEPTRKQIAESWKGGIVPEAAVSKASADHIRIAEKPTSVGRFCTV